jgi:8-oxo-dGTP pyrophosphatase MutT (NUDIX family)
MMILPNDRFHVGVYGILIDQERILLIKKARGAYKGMFDLPGGGIEFGEKIEETLKREFIEETGLVLSDFSFIANNECFSEYLNDQGEPRKLHHLGLYYKVSASLENLKTEPDGQDSLGAKFVDIRDLDKIMIDPIAREIIEKVF